MVSNIAETHKYRHAGGSDRKILGKEKNQILAQGEVYTYMQYIGKLIKTLKVPPTLHKGTKKLWHSIRHHTRRRKTQTKKVNIVNQASASIFDLVKTP